jgi:cytochrome b involved in lipid metabolism
MKLILALVAVVVLAGGGYWYVSTTPAYAPTVPVEQVTEDVTVPPVDTSADTSVDTTDVSMPTAFTLGDVALHSDRTSCWSAINGSVYDLTSWIDKHPGGASKILSICGKDGSSAFSNKHLGEPKPEVMLASFKLGALTQ